MIRAEFSTLFKNQPCICCGKLNSNITYPIDTDYASKISGYDIRTLEIGVTECDNCGHSYIQPTPRSSFLTAFYANYMSKAKNGFYKERSAENIPKQFRERYTPWLEKLSSFSSTTKSLLDIGGGLGMFLRLAQERSFEVTGVEPNVEAASALHEKYGIPVINCLFEEVETAQRVDVVTMWDLLEHLVDPRQALLKANDLLNKNGILLLEIPARDSLLHDLAKIVYRFSAGTIRRPLYLTYGVHHLHYFSEQGICKLLKANGFEVKQVYRGETDLNSLYHGQPGRRSVKAAAYNIILNSIFRLARIVGRQNKLIIFSQKHEKIS